MTAQQLIEKLSALSDEDRQLDVVFEYGVGMHDYSDETNPHQNPWPA